MSKYTNLIGLFSQECDINFECDLIIEGLFYNNGTKWIWAISSVGRVSRLHRGGRQFETVIAHHFFHYSGFLGLRECFLQDCQKTILN